MLGLDQNGVYVLSALAITIVVLLGYALYLRSRLLGLRRRAAAEARAGYDGSGLSPKADEDQSARNVMAAAPIPSTAHAASSAKGPTTP
jgi:hypothetical protein